MLHCDTAGVRAAADVLGQGTAVVLPTPTPLPYGVAAVVPEAVNVAKGRPAAQHVALWVNGGLAGVGAHLALDDRQLAGAEWLLTKELVTLLVPVARPEDVPAALRPAVRDGFALLAGPEFPPLAELRRSVEPLYVSSANATTRRPAVTAAEADDAFNHQLLVLDGDAHRDQSRPHASSTMLRMAPDGKIRVVRSGVHDAVRGPEGYLDDLFRRCPAEIRPAR